MVKKKGRGNGWLERISAAGAMLREGAEEMNNARWKCYTTPSGNQ